MLARVEARETEVTRLGRELRAAVARNHFSEAVAAALSRTRGAPREH